LALITNLILQCFGIFNFASSFTHPNGYGLGWSHASNPNLLTRCTEMRFSCDSDSNRASICVLLTYVFIWKSMLFSSSSYLGKILRAKFHRWAIFWRKKIFTNLVKNLPFFYIYMIKWMIFSKNLLNLIVNYMLLTWCFLTFYHMNFQTRIVAYNTIYRKMFKSLKNTLFLLLKAIRIHLLMH